MYNISLPITECPILAQKSVNTQLKKQAKYRFRYYVPPQRNNFKKVFERKKTL